MRWRFFSGEAMASIRGNAATTLAATVTVLIVTFLLGVTSSHGWKMGVPLHQTAFATRSR